MRNNYPVKRERATVCAKNHCVTVYGETAKFVNAIAIGVAFFSALALIDKALR
ncbi:MAG: hypothetical protein ACNS60_20505 [Candidatus Cyclobacteriaceae bacterium M2_1C_046]